jgi:hypothetical protein
MKLQGTDFDGSCSLLKTSKKLQPSAGRATCLTEFNPINRENLNFVELLLYTLCTLGMCCAVADTFPTYTAGILSLYHVITLCIAQTNCTVFDLNRRERNFKIGNLKFEHRIEETDAEFKEYYISFKDILIYF